MYNNVKTSQQLKIHVLQKKEMERNAECCAVNLYFKVNQHTRIFAEKKLPKLIVHRSE